MEYDVRCTVSGTKYQAGDLITVTDDLEYARFVAFVTTEQGKAGKIRIYARYYVNGQFNYGEVQ